MKTTFLILERQGMLRLAGLLSILYTLVNAVSTSCYSAVICP